MKILFVTVAWPKKGGNNLYTDLMDTFRDNGHAVYVLASEPKRNGRNTSYEIENRIHVLRVKTGNISKTKPVEKSLSLLLLGWQFKGAVREYFNELSFDLIIFNTPPITLSTFLKYLKRKYKCPLYLLLKDMWPYGFADNGLIKKNGFIYNYFKKHEKKLYEISDHIGCMSPKGVDFVLKQYPEIKPEKVEVCPNSVKINNNKRQINESESQKIRKKYGIPEEATVFIFSGNLGLGHGLDFFVDSILKLRNYRKAFFLIGGAGTHFYRTQKRIEETNPPNAFVYSYLPEDDFNKVMAVCEVGLILLSNNYTYPQFPSRLLGYLNNRMAVLCSVNEETDIGEIVEEHEVGFNTIHGDMEKFTNTVRRMSENKNKIREMGFNGFDLLKKKYSTEVSYNTIQKHFKKQ